MKTFSWKVTENCNSRCVTCNHWQTHKDGELSLVETKRLVNQCLENGVFRFRLTGGEPTMRPDLSKIIRYIQRCGATVSVNSNFILRKVPYDIHAVMTPLDGTRETYQKIRGLDAFDKVVSNLKDFRKHSDALIYVLTTLLPDTIGDIPDLLDLCRQLDAHFVINLLDTTPYFFTSAEPLKNHYNEAVELFDKLMDLYDKDLFAFPQWMLIYAPLFYSDMEKEIPCPLPKQGFRVGSSGEFYPNCWSVPPIANIRKTPISNILGSQQYRNVVRKLCHHECPGCTCGWMIRLRYYCGDWTWRLRNWVRNIMKRE